MAKKSGKIQEENPVKGAPGKVKYKKRNKREGSRLSEKRKCLRVEFGGKVTDSCEVNCITKILFVLDLIRIPVGFE